MPDESERVDDTDESNDDENDGDEYEVERFVSREEGAVVLQRLANSVANGSVELGDDGVVFAVPDQFELEIEYEREGKNAELEVELEWQVVDGEAIAAEEESEAHEGDKSKETGKETDTQQLVGELLGKGSTASKAQFELYRDRADEWRWRLVHANGNIIADSGEGYDRKAAARKGLESVRHNAPGAAVVDLDD